MKPISAVLCGLLLAAVPCSSALADPLTVDFSFNFSGPAFSGSGDFVTTSLGNNEYQITNVGGTVNGTAISGLLKTGSYPTGAGNVPNDNILFYPGSLGVNSPVYFDDAGVSFSVGTSQNSEYYVNLNDTLFFENAVAGPGPWYENDVELDKLSIRELPPSSPVPEPGSLALMGTGILAAAGAVRRRLCA